MKNIFDKKLNKIFLVMIIFILSICNFAYAEEEVPVSKDYINTEENGEIKYSDNIPQLAKRTSSDDVALPYVYFNDFSEYETVDSWEAYNNGENVNKLANDLGLTSFSEGKVFYEWLKTANSDGMTPSLELQPLCLYPETSEQIYCNDLDTVKAVDIKMQWNSDASAYLAALEKEKGKLGFLGTIEGSE